MHGHSGDQSHGKAVTAPVSERAGRRVVGLLFLVTGATASAAAAVVPMVMIGDGGQGLSQEAMIQAEGAILAGLVAGTVALLWYALRLCVFGAGERLAGDIRVLAGGGGRRIDIEEYPDLYPLPDAVNVLADRLVVARRDGERAMADAEERVADQTGRLAAILRDQNEGVLVCNLRHQILLHNPAALRLLCVEGDPGHARPLFSLMLADPVRHTLERLIRQNRTPARQADGGASRFIGGTPDGHALFDGRLSLILKDTVAKGGDGQRLVGYVLTFTDATRELAALGQRDALLRATTEDLRTPLANLRAVMETLDNCPDLAGESRTRFEAAMRTECEALTVRLEQIAEQYQATIAGTWPMSDLRSHTLIDLVRHRVGSHRAVTITPTGVPCRLHGDSFSLVVLWDLLVERVAATTGVTAFDLASEAAARWTYLDLIWIGEPIPSAAIDRWKSDLLPAALGGLTVGDVLRHHRSDLWSEARPGGRARLRLPLPPAQQPAEPRAPSVVRPESLDFSPLRQPIPAGDLASRLLERLSFVVFDLATTGDRPAEGDEIVAIAAVRIVDRRILTAETFETPVNPGRTGPSEVPGCHAITDAQIQDRPDAAAALAQFKGFIGDAVLVGHHAAFDLAVLRRKERSGGVRFDNPVLDTTLLSLWLDGPGADHSLDGIARRLGITAIDRQTAPDDSLITAAVLVAMLERLRDRGLTTLGDVLRESNALIDRLPREPPS